MSMSRKPLQNKENKQIFGKQLNLEKNPMIYYAWNIACDWFLGCPPLFSIYPPPIGFKNCYRILNPLSPDGTFWSQFWIREKCGNAREWRNSVVGRSLTRSFSPFLPYRFWQKSMCSEFGHLIVRWSKLSWFGQLVIELKWKLQTGQVHWVVSPVWARRWYHNFLTFFSFRVSLLYNLFGCLFAKLILFY